VTNMMPMIAEPFTPRAMRIAISRPPVGSAAQHAKHVRRRALDRANSAPAPSTLFALQQCPSCQPSNPWHVLQHTVPPPFPRSLSPALPSWPATHQKCPATLWESL
jgi:hypothetical protein